jgi:hypothetical protein
VKYNNIDGADIIFGSNRRTDAGPRDGEPTVVSYQRDGTRIEFKIRNATNHEIREFLIGVWAKLDKDDREDHINELLTYHPLLVAPERNRDLYLSDIAACIADRPELGRSKRR